MIQDLTKIDLRDQRFLCSPFHAQPSFHSHPELELVFVIEGFGTRIIGDKVERFEAGDMVFIGSNVPHVWLSDPAFYEKDSTLKSKVIVTYFNPKVFEQLSDFFREFRSIGDLIRQSSKGIKIFGETRKIIADKLLELAAVEGFKKITGLLEIMDLIASSNEISFITEEAIKSNKEAYRSDRLIPVVNFIKRNFDRPITLKQIADIACMTEQSFCRFFRKRMGRNFSQYLTEVRLIHAKELLIQNDKTVSDISYLCGFKSSSHFCAVFREQVGKTPSQYKSFPR